MSIICSDVEESQLTRKAAFSGASKFVRATVDLNTVSDLSFPTDYKISGCFLPKKYTRFADRIHNFKIRPDDIWIVHFPKVGSTWVHNIVWQLKNNLDFNAPGITSSHQLLEYCILYEDDEKKSENFHRFIDELDESMDKYEKLPSPRIFKSQLPAYLLPKDLWKVKPKIIYVTRNPKDTAVSAFHHLKNTLMGYLGTKEDYFEVFLKGYATYTPFHDHVLSFWQLHYLDNILFIAYEDLLVDQFAGIKKISKFLKCSYSDEQLQQLCDHVSFHHLKEKIPFETSASFKVLGDTRKDLKFE